MTVCSYGDGEHREIHQCSAVHCGHMIKISPALTTSHRGTSLHPPAYLPSPISTHFGPSCPSCPLLFSCSCCRPNIPGLPFMRLSFQDCAWRFPLKTSSQDKPVGGTEGCSLSYQSLELAGSKPKMAWIGMGPQLTTGRIWLTMARGIA